MGWVSGLENGNFHVHYVLKMSLRRYVKKTPKDPYVIVKWSLCPYITFCVSTRATEGWLINIHASIQTVASLDLTTHDSRWANLVFFRGVDIILNPGELAVV